MIDSEICKAGVDFLSPGRTRLQVRDNDLDWPRSPRRTIAYRHRSSLAGRSPKLPQVGSNFVADGAAAAFADRFIAVAGLGVFSVQFSHSSRCKQRKIITIDQIADLVLDGIIHAANHDVAVGQQDVVVVKRREAAADWGRVARRLLNRLSISDVSRLPARVWPVHRDNGSERNKARSLPDWLGSERTRRRNRGWTAPFLSIVMASKRRRTPLFPRPTKAKHGFKFRRMTKTAHISVLVRQMQAQNPDLLRVFGDQRDDPLGLSVNCGVTVSPIKAGRLWRTSLPSIATIESVSSLLIGAGAKRTQSEKHKAVSDRRNPILWLARNRRHSEWDEHRRSSRQTS